MAASLRLRQWSTAARRAAIPHRHSGRNWRLRVPEAVAGIAAAAAAAAVAAHAYDVRGPAMTEVGLQQYRLHLPTCIFGCFAVYISVFVRDYECTSRNRLDKTTENDTRYHTVGDTLGVVEIAPPLCFLVCGSAHPGQLPL